MVEIATTQSQPPPDDVKRSGGIMDNEMLEFELARLRDQQAQTREDEVFGGSTPAEQAAYELRQDRIRELESALSERSGGRQRSPDRSQINR